MSDKRIHYIRNIATKSLLCLTALGGLMSACIINQEELDKLELTSPLPTSTSEELVDETFPTPTLVENISPETVVIPTNTVGAPIEMPEAIIENIPYVSTEKNESFDMEAINLLEWEDFTLEKEVTLDISETVITAGEKNYLYLIPTFGGGNTSNIPLTKLEIPSDFHFNIKQKKTISNGEGESVTLGMVENTFENWSVNSSLGLLLGGSDKEGNIQGFVEEQEIRHPSVSFVNSLYSVSPSEVEALLVSLLKISNFQEEAGGISIGKEISLKEVLEPESSLPYNSVLKYFSGTDSIASSLKLLSNKEEEVLTIVDSKTNSGTEMIRSGIKPGPFTIKDFGWTTSLGKGEDFVFKFNGEKEGETKYFINIEPIFSNIENVRRAILSGEEAKILYGASISLVEYSEEYEDEVKLQMQRQVEDLKSLYDNYLLYLKENSGEIPMGKDLVPMNIPREAYAYTYYLSDNALYKLVGRERPISVISDEEYFNWYFKENPNK